MNHTKAVFFAKVKSKGKNGSSVDLFNKFKDPQKKDKRSNLNWWVEM